MLSQILPDSDQRRARAAVPDATLVRPEHDHAGRSRRSPPAESSRIANHVMTGSRMTYHSGFGLRAPGFSK
jgi:hypothetical protein